jgi:hypothetical protein
MGWVHYCVSADGKISVPYKENISTPQRRWYFKGLTVGKVGKNDARLLDRFIKLL